MLNNIFKKDNELDENQIRANDLVEQALKVGDVEGNVLVLFDPRHYQDYRQVQDQIIKLESKTIRYTCKQQVDRRDISKYLDYIEHDLATEKQKENIFFNLFVQSRDDIDCIIKKIINKKVPVTYFVI